MQSLASLRCSSRAAGHVAIVRPTLAAPARPQVQHQQHQQHRQVAARFFRLGGNNAEQAGVVGSQGRDDFTYDDLEQYFNYMGFLAEEGTYDRMEATLKKAKHPIDAILLLACSENDTPKVQEIVKAGADLTVTDLNGKTPLEIATKPELVAFLKDAASKGKVAA